MNLLGDVSWYQVTTRIAASTAIGIMLIYVAPNNTAVSIKSPWMIADSFVLAPAWRFTELLTMTDVIGSQPKNHDIIFHIPCAMSSRFIGVWRPWWSSLSIALTERIVSMLATRAIVIAVVRICGLR